MHYYQFNIGDYARRTRYLTNNQDLAYRRMLDIYYLSEAPFKSTAQEIANDIGMENNTPDIELVLKKFFPGGKNKHADEELSKYIQRAENSRENGKLGGRPKTQGKPSGIPDKTHRQPDDNLNQEPRTKNHKDIKTCQKPNGLLTHSTDVLNLWNEYASTHSLPQKRAAPDNLRSQINTISKKQKWNLKDWDTFLNILSESDFLMGKSSNWKMNMDWLAKPSNFSKAISGNYTT